MRAAVNTPLAIPVAVALGLLACGASGRAPRDGGDAGMDRGGAGGFVADAGGPGGGDAAQNADAAGGGADAVRDADAAGGGNGGSLSDGGGGAAADAGPAEGSDGGVLPESLFVATYLGGLSSFTVDDLTGRPTPAGPRSDVGAQLYGLAVHPSGRFAYATDFRGALISYALTPGTGAIAHLPGSPTTIGSAAIAAAIDPTGRFLYVGDEQSLHVFAVDPSTGALTAVPHSPFDVGGRASTIAFHPSGRFLFASFGAIGPDQHGGIRTFALDATSGAPAEATGSPYLNDEVRGGAVVMHPSGKFLYVGSFSSIQGLGVDQQTGSLAPLPGFPVAGGNSDATAIDVAIDPQGRYLYATEFVGSIFGYRIDADSGALAAVPGSPFDGSPSPYSLAVDPAGRFVYVGNDDANLMSVFSLDRASGALAPIAGSPFSVTGLQPEIALTGGRRP